MFYVRKMLVALSFATCGLCGLTAGMNGYGCGGSYPPPPPPPPPGQAPAARKPPQAPVARKPQAAPVARNPPPPGLAPVARNPPTKSTCDEVSSKDVAAFAKKVAARNVQEQYVEEIYKRIHDPKGTKASKSAAMQELKESAARGNPYAMQELATANGQSQKHVDKLFRTCFSRDPAKAAAAKQELINLAEEDVLAKQQLDNLEERKAKLANTARQKSKTPANNEDLYAKFRARRATTIAKSSRAPQTGAAPTSDAVSAVPAPSACGSGDLLENDSEEWYIIGDDDEDMGDEGMETDFE